MALALLCDLDAPDTATIAAGIQSDASSPAELKQIALKTQLLSSPPDDAAQAAINGFSSADEAIKRLAVVYLAQGPDALSDFSYGIYIYKSSTISFRSSEDGAIPQREAFDGRGRPAATGRRRSRRIGRRGLSAGAD